MKEFLIVGVDVSKSTLDMFYQPLNQSIRIDNTQAGFKKWLEEFKSIVPAASRVMVVMEHTGRYSYEFESFLRSAGLDYCKIPALEIKRSLGVTRGKTDKVDAKRIAHYGWLRREGLQPEQPRQEAITALRDILGLRTYLVKQRSGHRSRVKEMKATQASMISAELIEMEQELISVLSVKITELEKRMQLLIETHEDLHKTFVLLKTIKGVGKIIAAYMIGSTDNFTRFKDARKFNCYAGLAPFKHESGSSVRGRSRVSHLANKEVKRLLNLGASSAIQYNPEMKAYYQKRVAEGKRPMSCLNIIRSKMVARMFAVVKRQTPYQEVAPAA
jgi:transposase